MSLPIGMMENFHFERTIGREIAGSNSRSCSYLFTRACGGSSFLFNLLLSNPHAFSLKHSRKITFTQQLPLLHSFERSRSLSPLPLLPRQASTTDHFPTRRGLLTNKERAHLFHQKTKRRIAKLSRFLTLKQDQTRQNGLPTRHRLSQWPALAVRCHLS